MDIAVTTVLYYNEVMNIILILLSILSGTAVWQPEDTKIVTGRITTPDGNPLIGATVMVIGTNLGAMSHVNGHYFIENVPIANLVLRGSMVGMGETTLRPEITSEDTLHVDIELVPYGAQFTFSIERKYSNFHPSQPLQIQIENWQELDLNLNQIWYKEHLVQGQVLNDSTLMTYLPYYADEVFLTVFDTRETRVPLDVNSETIRVTLNRNPVLPNMELQETVSAEYSHIDLTEWGNSQFRNWGIIGTEVTFSEDGSPRILIVYHDQAVVINKHSNPIVIPFPFPTLRYQCDPSLNQLLIWDIHGQNFTSGNAAVISLEEGTYSVFDPTPEIDEPVQHTSVYAGHINTAPHYYGPRYLLSSSGEIVRYGRDSIRFYNSSGTQTTRIFFEAFGVENFFPYYWFLAQNEAAVSALFTDGSFSYCTTVSLSGSVLHLSRLPSELFTTFSVNNFLTDPTQATVWRERSIEGLRRIDCLTGEHIYLDHRSDKIVPGTSPGVFHSWNSCPNEDSSIVETIDWNTGDLLDSSTQAKAGTFDARIRGLAVLSGNPVTMGFNRALRNAVDSRYAYLLNNSGEPVWLSPPLHNSSSFESGYYPRRLADFSAVQSPNGSFAVLPDGRYLVIVKFDLTDL